MLNLSKILKTQNMWKILFSQYALLTTVVSHETIQQFGLSICFEYATFKTPVNFISSNFTFYLKIKRHQLTMFGKSGNRGIIMADIKENSITYK